MSISPRGLAGNELERVIRSGWGWTRKLLQATSRPLTGVAYLELAPAGQEADLTPRADAGDSVVPETLGSA